MKLTKQDLEQLNNDRSITIDGVTIEPPNGWEPKGGGWSASSVGPIRITSNNDTQLYGIEFKTEEEAKEGHEQFRIYHLMYQAWKETLDEFGNPDYRADFNINTQPKYCAVFGHNTNDLVLTERYQHQDPHGFWFPEKEQAKSWADKVGHLIPRLGV